MVILKQSRLTELFRAHKCQPEVSLGGFKEEGLKAKVRGQARGHTAG